MNKKTIISFVFILAIILLITNYSLNKNVKGNSNLGPEEVVEKYLTLLDKNNNFDDVLAYIDTDSLSSEQIEKFRLQAVSEEFVIETYDINKANCIEDECIVPTYVRLKGSSGDMNYLKLIKKEGKWLLQIEY